jgi:hypothetical protein
MAVRPALRSVTDADLRACYERNVEQLLQARKTLEYRRTLGIPGGSANMAFAEHALSLAVLSLVLDGELAIARGLLKEAATALRAFQDYDGITLPSFTVLCLAPDVAGLHAAARRAQDNRWVERSKTYRRDWGRPQERRLLLSVASGDRARAVTAVSAALATYAQEPQTTVLRGLHTPIALLLAAAIGLRPAAAAAGAVGDIGDYIRQSRGSGDPVVSASSLYSQRAAAALGLARLAGLDPLPQADPLLLPALAAALPAGALFADEA